MSAVGVLIAFSTVTFIVGYITSGFVRVVIKVYNDRFRKYHFHIVVNKSGGNVYLIVCGTPKQMVDLMQMENLHPREISITLKECNCMEEENG